MPSDVTVVKRFLTKRNEDEYRTVFRRCFTENWRSSIPFPRDQIYAALIDGRVVGFCMVHDQPPEKMPQGPGAYMYNLCVDPEYRRRGAGSALVRTVVADHPQCYSHNLITDGKQSAFMERLGWTRVGATRQYYEWAHFADPEMARQVKPCEPAMWNPRQYSAINNVVYVDAHMDCE